MLLGTEHLIERVTHAFTRSCKHACMHEDKTSCSRVDLVNLSRMVGKMIIIFCCNYQHIVCIVLHLCSPDDATDSEPVWF